MAYNAWQYTVPKGKTIQVKVEKGERTDPALCACCLFAHALEHLFVLGLLSLLLFGHLCFTLRCQLPSLGVGCTKQRVSTEIATKPNTKIRNWSETGQRPNKY